MSAAGEAAVDWREHARWLADRLAHPRSRWHEPIATMPRHLLVPRWFQRAADGDGWVLREGASDPDAWMSAAYHNTRSLVTQVGSLHTDHAASDQRPTGQPTSSSTNPWLVMQMYRHARIHDGCDVLDVGTGSGYGAGTLARRFGDTRITSVDIDPYLTTIAAERLGDLGVRPRTAAADATGDLDWTGDRIVSMVAVHAVPAGWLTALRTGGRLVTTIARTSIIITAHKTDDGGAWGTVEHDHAGFMTTRTIADHSASPRSTPQPDRAPEGHSPEEHSRGRYPVIDVANAREIQSVLELDTPGIEHRYHQDPDGERTAWMTHPDGSWAKAVGRKGEPAEVYQGGPRRLWDTLENIRTDWLTNGYLHLYGADVRINPDGTTHVTTGTWHATIRPAKEADSRAAQPPA